ncbi:MAG: hypothetical protein WBS24_11945 [Terriglobales bacterium]
MSAPVPTKIEAAKVEPAKPAADSIADSAANDRHRHHHAAYAAEASGLLVIALLLLVLVLIRYWPYIRWSAR